MSIDNNEEDHRCPKCGHVLCTCPVDFTGSSCSTKFYTGLDDFAYRDNKQGYGDYKFY